MGRWGVGRLPIGLVHVRYFPSSRSSLPKAASASLVEPTGFGRRRNLPLAPDPVLRCVDPQRPQLILPSLISAFLQRWTSDNSDRHINLPC